MGNVQELENRDAGEGGNESSSAIKSALNYESYELRKSISILNPQEGELFSPFPRVWASTYDFS